MTAKSLEIFYDAATVALPGKPPDKVLLAAPDFRNAAMEHIETALMSYGLGEWVGAEVGMSEVNFGFDVEDFDAAEACVRAAVKDTAFDCIREFERHEFDESDVA